MAKTESQKRMLIAAKTRKKRLQLVECFDANKVHSRANDKQDSIHKDTLSLYKIIRSGNQAGKTQLMVRDYVWKLAENHPYWERRTGSKCPTCKSTSTTYLDPTIEKYGCNDCDYEWISWGTTGLTFLAVLQTGKHIEDMWNKRFKPFFDEADVKVDTKGGIIQSVTHTKTGNTIYFFSHDNATEVRKRVQYFVAHDVWIDEMPAHYKVYEELQRRVDAMQGQFSATLTPKVTNIEVKNFLDNLSPDLHTLYRMTKLDNPIYKGREEVEMAKLQSLPEADRRAILFGDWIFAGELRLNVNMNQIKPLPSYYSRTWDHVVCIDPAAAGKIGFTIFGKDPTDIDTWWVVKALHLKGTAPSVLIKEIIPPHTVGLNIVKRVADPHEAWFREESLVQVPPIEYDAPFDKVHRRKELLASGEEALINPKMFFADGETTQLITELNTAIEDPNKPGHIKNATKYHCIDAWIYGLDLLPKYTVPPKPMSMNEQLRYDWVQQEANAPPPPSAPKTVLPNISARAKKVLGNTSIRWGRRR